LTYQFIFFFNLFFKRFIYLKFEYIQVYFFILIILFISIFNFDIFIDLILLIIYLFVIKYFEIFNLIFVQNFSKIHRLFFIFSLISNVIVLVNKYNYLIKYKLLFIILFQQSNNFSIVKFLNQLRESRYFHKKVKIILKFILNHMNIKYLID